MPCPFVPKNKLEHKLADDWSAEAWRDVTIVVAVSGGADSVALLRALHRLKDGQGQGRLVVAHYNHALRADESDADEQFVRSLCDEIGIDACVETFNGDWSAVANAKEGLEAAAREVRHAFLLQTAQEQGARHIVTAHTADDQVETILHRIIRGTGIAGLSGIPRTREVVPGIALIRPMLQVTRREVIEYLDALKQSYRTDSTNAQTCYTRNRIRNRLLPLLREEFNASVDEAVTRLGELAGEAQETIARIADETYDNSAKCDTTGERISIQRCELAKNTPYIVREILIRAWTDAGWPLRDMGRDEWRILADMLLGKPNADTKRTFPGNIMADQTDDGLQLHRK